VSVVSLTLPAPEVRDFLELILLHRNVQEILFFNLKKVSFRIQAIELMAAYKNESHKNEAVVRGMD
jgi:hypothetical protein